MERYAVIDLGTNTFHLKIVELSTDGSFIEHYRDRQFVRLGESGIATLGEAPYQRGIETILGFHELLRAQPIKRLRATGTAALRTATNGAAFIEEVFQKTGIKIELISGQEEARLIYEGVRLAVPTEESHDLIMDIGGGSVEFILGNCSGLLHLWSFPVGMSVLYRAFHLHDPINVEEVAALHQHLDQVFAPMFDQLKGFSIRRLVGASGTFEVLANMLSSVQVNDQHFLVKAQDLHSIIPNIVYTTKAERLNRPDIPSERADMIVVAFLLIEHLLTNIAFEEVVVSEYALREGVLGEMIK